MEHSPASNCSKSGTCEAQTEHLPVGYLASNCSKLGTCEARIQARIHRLLASNCSKRGTCEAGESASAGKRRLRAATEAEKLI